MNIGKGWRSWQLLFFLLAASLVSAAQTSIFSVQSSPSPDPAGNTLNDVAAVSDSDAWAVGYKHSNNLNGSLSLIEHWDGNSWKLVQSPNPGRCTQGNFGNVLTALSIVAANDIWAAGYSFNCDALIRPMVVHWNGTKWQTMPTPNLVRTALFYDVAAFAANDAYAVGYKTATNGASQTLVEHWDGLSWKVVPTPNANGTGNVLFSISGTSASDIWATGSSVAPNIPVLTLGLHFDGTSWKIVPTPSPQQGGDLDQNVLIAVQAVAPNDATAVGYILDTGQLRRLTLIEHWDGTKWSVVNSPNVSTTPGSFNTFTGVTAFAANDLYATGYFVSASTAAQQKTMVAHFDGSSWTIIPSPTRGLAQQLNGIFALPGTRNLWTVGGAAINGTDPEFGLLINPRTLVLFSPIG